MARGLDELAPEFRRLKAERLTPERPTTWGRHPSPGMNQARSIPSGFRSPFEWIESRQLGQHAVLTLPRDSGCDVIASLPVAASGSGTSSLREMKSDPAATD